MQNKIRNLHFQKRRRSIFPFPITFEIVSICTFLSYFGDEGDLTFLLLQRIEVNIQMLENRQKKPNGTGEDSVSEGSGTEKKLSNRKTLRNMKNCELRMNPLFIYSPLVHFLYTIPRTQLLNHQRSPRPIWHSANGNRNEAPAEVVLHQTRTARLIGSFGTFSAWLYHC